MESGYQLAIGIMTVNGILDIHIVHGSADGDVFLDFVEKCLLPCLMLFDGKNPNSVVILHNCSHCASHRVNWGYGALFATLLTRLQPYWVVFLQSDILFGTNNGAICEYWINSSDCICHSNGRRLSELGQWLWGLYIVVCVSRLCSSYVASISFRSAYSRKTCLISWYNFKVACSILL